MDPRCHLRVPIGFLFVSAFRNICYLSQKKGSSLRKTCFPLLEYTLESRNRSTNHSILIVIYSPVFSFFNGTVEPFRSHNCSIYGTVPNILLQNHIHIFTFTEPFCTYMQVDFIQNRSVQETVLFMKPFRIFYNKSADTYI